MSKHYVNNKDLCKALSEYRTLYLQDKENKPRYSEYIGLCIYTIAHKLANKPNYIGYSYKSEMIGDGIENCIMYLHNFDPAKSNNAFAYITQIIKFSFHRRIMKEKKQQYIKLKNAEQYYSEYDDEHIDGKLFDNSYEYIAEYEKNLSDKKKRSKLTGLEKFFK